MIFCSRCGKRNSDDAWNCSNCGSSLNNPAAQVEPPVREEKVEQVPYEYDYAAYEATSNKRKWIIAGVVAAIAVVIAFIAFGGGGKKSAQFKMNGAGDLYYDGDITSPIKIPRKFDGEASGFEDTNQLYGVDFSYDGSLERFLKYHSWVFQQSYPRGESSKSVHCEDYTITFGLYDGALGADISYRNGSSQLIRPRFQVSGNNADECFENLSEVYEWLEEN